MKQLKLFFAIMVLPIVAISSEPFRDPFVVLRVQGTEYQPGSEITVRPGERIVVEAILMGGRRDYCMYPEKYANIGRTTIVEQTGENVMSFNVAGGEHRGVWKLLSEKATFTSGKGVMISSQKSSSGFERSALIEVPKSGLAKVFLRVNAETNWNYTRWGPAGKNERTEGDSGSSLFNLVILAEDGVWFSSANIVAKGKENFRIRNHISRVQEFYDLISENLQKKNTAGAQMHVQNLKTYVNEVNQAIDEAKKEDPSFECEVTFVGLPTDIPMEHLNNFRIMAGKWVELHSISGGNVSQINNTLLRIQDTFTANILKSVIKNYVNWGTSIPTSWEDMTTLYDPKNIFVPLDLPRKILSWTEEAEKDASILKNQVQNIKMLSELREFYLDRMERSVEERKEIEKLIKDLSHNESYHNDLKSFFQGLSWASWKGR
jgi:hypothetical protein